MKNTLPGLKSKTELKKKLIIEIIKKNQYLRNVFVSK